MDVQPNRFGPLRIAKIVLIEEEPTVPVTLVEEGGDGDAAAVEDPPA